MELTSPALLLLKYTLFAILATGVNIFTQEIALRVYSAQYAVTISILAGTLSGLLVKYTLDKKYIFGFQTETWSHDTRLFTLYTTMGIITTLIFWGTELGFDAIFNSKEMRYLGGVLGLALGYWIKYHLDKRFVFPRQAY
jgi:putative flippase GtrA